MLKAGQTPVISTRLLERLVAFYAPREFTNESTQFDTGYEQCKRDLRNLLLQAVPDLAEIDRWGFVKEEPTTQQAKEEVSKWWKFGKQH